MHTDSAAVPSAGHVALRQTVQYARFADDPTAVGREVNEFRAVTSVEYGLRPDLTLTAYFPLVYREIDFTGARAGAGAGATATGAVGALGDKHDGPHPGDPAVTGNSAWADFALDDFTVAFKYRLYRNDFGPIDTARFSVVAGAELPSGAEPFSSDPVVGGVFTYIRGRHGLNAELMWKFNTSGAAQHPDGTVRAGEGHEDALFCNAAYLFRVAPQQFSARTAGALYGIAEINAAYETNGDKEVLIAPGLLYETRTFAVEASVQLPALRDLDERPGTQFTVTLGVRFLF